MDDIPNFKLLYSALWEKSVTDQNHIWTESKLSDEYCVLDESICLGKRNGSKRICCAVCKLVLHQSCLESNTIKCRPTFRQSTVRDYRDRAFLENSQLRHHWILRKRFAGKCDLCSKTFQRMDRGVAFQCSWCKIVYHQKACFSDAKIFESCNMGEFRNLIVPPSWIIKLSEQFHSSIRKSKSQLNVSNRVENKAACEPECQQLSGAEIDIAYNDCGWANFIVKPTATKSVSGGAKMEACPSKPLVVFINPKSGGNQGVKLIRKFLHLLNPRQVFDLSNGGPELGLRLFGMVRNLRILACGGDGTASWIMHSMDKLGIPFSPIALLPLGTGNDLSRISNWGGGYSDEPLTKILSCLESGSTFRLDRWTVDASALPESNVASGIMANLATSTATLLPPHTNLNQLNKSKTQSHVVQSLPANVFNNYFSFGADAAAALTFHELREANPAKFNSRLKNKIYYVKIGGAGILRRAWRDLAEYVELECDGVNMRDRLNAIRPHIILFLNIASYTSGTNPWGNPSASNGFQQQRPDDELLEVIGLTSSDLATLRVGNHGSRISQCKSAVIRTYRVIPVQVDGEPCKISPSIIKIHRRNQANLIARINVRKNNFMPELLEETFQSNISINLLVISIDQYNKIGHSLENLKKLADIVTKIELVPNSTLTELRQIINTKFYAKCNALEITNFTFLDTISTYRVFRIDNSHESDHFIFDICDMVSLYIVSNSSRDRQLLMNQSNNNFKIPLDYNSEMVKEEKYFHSKLNPRSLTPTFTNDAQFEHSNYFIDPSKLDPNDLFNSAPSLLDQNEVGVTSADQNSTWNEKLISACKTGRIEEVKHCFDRGADWMAVDRYGRTTLHLATETDKIEVVRFLLSHCPRELLDARDLLRGQTALHRAAFFKNYRICVELLSANCSTRIKDYQNKTAFELAYAVGDNKLGSYLQKKTFG